MPQVQNVPSKGPNWVLYFFYTSSTTDCIRDQENFNGVLLPLLSSYQCCIKAAAVLTHIEKVALWTVYSGVFLHIAQMLQYRFR